MYMGEVDLADFCCAANGRSRKSPKWWHRIFWGLLDRTLTNSFVVFTILTHENMTMLTYRRHVVQSLITLAKPPKVGRAISNVTPSGSQSVSKRHKSNYSVKYLFIYFSTFILSKLEFGFYKSYIYGLCTPVKNTFPNKYN